MVGQQQEPFPHRVLVGIPAYNAEGTIGSIVRRVKSLPVVRTVVVVDDGSSDDTTKVAQAEGALVLRHRTNLGAGAATRSCFDAARGSDATILVTLDADGQHNPDEIPDLLPPIVEDRADIVIGSRFLTGNNEVPLYRSLGIRAITLLCNWGYRTRITDAQSCYRAYGKRALAGLAVRDPGFGFSVETLIEARLKGLSIAEVPVSCIYNSVSHTSSPLIHGSTVAFAVLKHRAAQSSGRPIYIQFNEDPIPHPMSSRQITPSTRSDQASHVRSPLSRV